MEANNKFLKFVAKLEQKMLDSNQESMILIGTQNEQFIGGSNDGRCTNDAQSCDSSINNRCTNRTSSGCDGSMNERRCTVKPTPSPSFF
jgi:hypothetical protein